MCCIRRVDVSVRFPVMPGAFIIRTAQRAGWCGPDLARRFWRATF
ncbi:hypothetical protein ACS15_0422 [Ralstonia insidiosa]|uniref:Uncharacterized protein n=1 Tax=Ralstonia insidiosa TaxID=190721 RepID=A0AAC9FPI8_9RALS|nr:hypothetical protein ACS15_0422 [Ralstonia insidiosa]